MKIDKTIGKELSEIAPVLASLTKPKNEAISAFYFDSLKESTLAKIRKEDVLSELQSVAPTLFSLPKSNLETVPANYFESLPNTIFAAIQQQETLRQVQRQNAEKTGFFAEISIWIERLFAAPQWQMALAIFVAVALLSGVYSSFSTEAKNGQLLAEAKANLTQEDIQTYLLEHSDEVDETILENQAEQSGVHIQPAINADDVRAYMKEENLSEENIENV